MPIPPRPIPSSSRHGARPGGSVPRKFSPGNQHTLDWRVEVALLQELGPAMPKSVPSSSGVQMVDEKATPVGARSMGREVDLEGLIRDGRGKREKKATTATSLGFDFVPDPSILALPEEQKPSLLSTTKSTTLPIKSTPQPALTAPPAALGTTPSTPGLVPTLAEEEEDSDWEHIPDPLEVDEDMIVLGELELDDPPEEEVKKHKVRGGVSYAKIAAGAK